MHLLLSSYHFSYYTGDNKMSTAKEKGGQFRKYIDRHFLSPKMITDFFFNRV
jgi:hypothetical protein